MLAALRGYTFAVMEEFTGDDGAKVADDIEAVYELVTRSGALGVTLTDFGVPAAARRELLQELLSSRIDPAALRLVLRAVGTSRTDELPTTLHELFELARNLHNLGAGQVRAEEPILSRGGWRNYSAGYAQAIFEGLARTDDLEEIEDQLFHLARVVEAHPELRTALSDSSRPVLDRSQLLQSLLAGKADSATIRLAGVSLYGRVRDFAGALDWLAEQAAQARGWRVARVRRRGRSTTTSSPPSSRRSVVSRGNPSSFR